MKNIVLPLLCFVLSSTVAKSQIIVDTDFESNTNPFAITNGSPVLSSDYAHSGSYSAYFYPAVDNYSNKWGMFEASKIYHYSFWIKSSDPGALKLIYMPTDAYAKIDTTIIHADVYHDIDLRSQISYSNTWEKVAFDLYTGTPSLSNDFGLAGNITIGIWGQGAYFDDLKIEKAKILVSSITIMGENNATTITSPAGTIQMLSIVLPEDADNKELSWSVENLTGEASVNETGLLTALSNGQVKVRATPKDTSTKFGEIIITISGQESGFSDVLSSFKLFPNPIVNQLNISSTALIERIEILSADGITVLSSLINQNNANIPVTPLMNGFYLVCITYPDGQVKICKVVKE